MYWRHSLSSHIIEILASNYCTTELASLKYVAIDEGYLEDTLADHHLTIAGLKNALKAMKTLKEMIVVRDITLHMSNDYSSEVQVKFYAERRFGQAEAGWHDSIEELPDVQREYAE